MTLALLFLLANQTPVVAQAPDEAQPRSDARVQQCAPQKTRPGTVSVQSQPWTRVFIDDKAVGSTPLFRAPVKAGRHALRVVNTERGVDFRQEIVVEAGKTLKISLFLQGGDETLELPPLPRSAAKDRACPPDPNAYLSVQTTPWARVFVDDDAIGSTPLFKHPLAPGKHRLRLVQKERGGRGAVERHAQIELRAGETLKLSLDDNGAKRPIPSLRSRPKASKEGR